eukprot:COSAG01_NODE_31682_length_593_cov_0.767206_1_plen_49_part_10
MLLNQYSAADACVVGLRQASVTSSSVVNSSVMRCVQDWRLVGLLLGQF